MASGTPTEQLTRLAGEQWAGADIDGSLAPLIYTGLPSTPGILVDVRHQLEGWANDTGLPISAVADLVLASYEALANAAEHAYPFGAGLIDLLAARTTDGRVLVTVRDHGRWRPPPPDPGFRGRGLQMIMALSHQAQIQHGPQGTTVHMEWLLPAS